MQTKLSNAEIDSWKKQYSGLLDAINIGFMLCDPFYLFYDVSQTFLQMVGANAEEYVGHYVQDYFSPEEFQQLYEIVEPLEIELKKNKSIDEKKYYQFEWYWYHHQTREKIPMLFTGAVNTNAEGEHISTYVTCTDLRVQKQIQAELQQGKQMLETILFGIGDCVTIYGPTGAKLLSNPQGAEIKGSSQDALLHLKAGNRKIIELNVLGELRKFEGKIEAISNSRGKTLAYAEILKDITDHLKLEKQEQELKQIRQEMNRLNLGFKIVGDSRQMRNIFDLILRCAAVDSSILILGETGVGKELVARAIHSESDRKNKPFIAINCGALPETLLESELFGHKKGAFTGATADHIGLFRQADGGTLFLDEVGDLSPVLQVKLLRVLQEREVRPVGGDKTFPIDVRVISATHQDLEQLANQGKYRRDFYYRLAVIPIVIPPLRQRMDDIIPLARHFIAKHSSRNKQSKKVLNLASQQILLDYNWPGNVRELENCIEHALAMSNGSTLEPDDFPSKVFYPKSENAVVGNTEIERNTVAQNQAALPKASIDPEFGLKPWELEEKEDIEKALIRNKGKRNLTAKDLGVCRATLYRKMRLYRVNI
ncbi:MAG: sigma 54-interacting transcriptional regulator [Deltaproteobacteria bacterium]|nr:sigma 54-interacting transcriptional regulator [Deltaproteobacteria bacterium]MBT7151609.1 sigma 54-interacting transcriptional regulator [Deltaproteobacteria bacterium]